MSICLSSLRCMLRRCNYKARKKHYIYKIHTCTLKPRNIYRMCVYILIHSIYMQVLSTNVPLNVLIQSRNIPKMERLRTKSQLDHMLHINFIIIYIHRNNIYYIYRHLYNKIIYNIYYIYTYIIK